MSDSEFVSNVVRLLEDYRHFLIDWIYTPSVCLAREQSRAGSDAGNWTVTKEAALADPPFGDPRDREMRERAEGVCRAAGFRLRDLLRREDQPASPGEWDTQLRADLLPPCVDLKVRLRTVERRMDFLERLVPFLDGGDEEHGARRDRPCPVEDRDKKAVPPHAVELLLGGESQQILGIVQSRLSADKKMRNICGIDLKYLAWGSPEWAELLSVSEQAVRAGEFWRVDRPRLRQDV